VNAEGIIVGVNHAVTVGLIMPLANTDLQRLLRDATFTYQMRLKILYDILKGVKFMHDNDYLHLDIKPMNVLIFGEGGNIQGRVTDFGISLLMENHLSKHFPQELVTDRKSVV